MVGGGIETFLAFLCLKFGHKKLVVLTDFNIFLQFKFDCKSRLR